MVSMPTELACSVLDAAPDALIIIDSSGSICFANRQLSALFGYTHEEIIGRPVEWLLPERLRTRHVLHRDHYARNVRARPMGMGLPLFGRRRDGVEFPLEVSLSPISDSRGTLIAAAIRDISDRKRAEAELIVARESAERARELAIDARESADRANEGKSRFLATASHDLRQPLQTLALLNGTLRRMVHDPDAAEAIAQQELAIGAMSRLLNALLDISKLESGAIKPEPTDFPVAALFRELRSEFANLAANKGLELRIGECADYVHSDPSLVEQILRNLVSNAIKYTRRGCVELRCLHHSAQFRIEVLDTGIGISADQIPYIYDEFYQVGVPTNSSRDGYGLGLAIVHRLVKLLRLELEVRSEVGRGSTFALLVPAAHTLPARLPDAERAPLCPTCGGVGVLLVEDDPSVRSATRMLLQVEGFRVTAVATLAEAMQRALAGEHIDLLIADYHLQSGETGTQVIQALRETLGNSLKAVLITGDTSSAVRDLPRDAALRLASKPLQADELLGLMRGLLGS
jgi:PAS domain S-box-containing protein